MKLMLSVVAALLACQGAALQSKYFLSTAPATWSQARMACAQQGARLAVIKTSDDQAMAANMCRSAGKSCWIGLSDVNNALTNGQAWVWVDGSISGSRLTFWYQGEPSNSDGVEHCVHLRSSDNYYWNDKYCGYSYIYLCERTKQHTVSPTPNPASTPTSPPPGQIEKRPRQTASILIQGDPHDCKVKSQSGSSTDLIKIEKAGTLAAIMFKSKRGGVTSHRDLSGRAFWGNAGVNEFIVAVGHRADSSSPFELIYPKTGTKNFDGLVAREDMYRMKGVTTKDHKLLFVGPTYEVSPGDELRFCGLNSFSKSAFLTGNYGGTTYANVDLFYEVETFPGIGGLAVTRGRLVGSIGLVTLLVVLCVVAPIAYVRVKRRGFAGLKDATGPVYGATTAHTQGL